jgi:hypothetical protein
MTPSELPNLPEESQRAYERIAKEVFAVFRAGGQAESVAKGNAEKFAREYIQGGKTGLGSPLFSLMRC